MGEVQNWRRWAGDQWQRFSWFGTVIGVVILVIGVPSLFENIETWARWLTQPPWLQWLRRLPSDWIQEQGAWWGFVIAGILLIFLSNLPRLLMMVGKAEWAMQLGIVAPAPLVLASARSSPYTGVQITEPVPVPEENTMPDETEEAPPAESVPMPFRPAAYEDRYGVLWKVNKSDRVYTGVFASLNSILNAPPRIKIEGPFCRQDGTLLRFKDVQGDRYLMDGDDIGADGGCLYCDLCHAETRPDPNYHGERNVSNYREALRKELQDEYRRVD